MFIEQIRQQIQVLQQQDSELDEEKSGTLIDELKGTKEVRLLIAIISKKEGTR